MLDRNDLLDKFIDMYIIKGLDIEFIYGNGFDLFLGFDDLDNRVIHLVKDGLKIDTFTDINCVINHVRSLISKG